MSQSMTRHVAALSAGLALLSIAGWASYTPSAVLEHTLAYANPVFTKDFPDPMVLRLGRHDYWAYGTSTTWENGYFPILHSTDLVHWRYAGDAFSAYPAWANGDFWAPDVVKRGKTYFLYFVGKRSANHCIGVATAARPQGPFTARTVVGCGDANGSGWIDPDLFVDQDGKAYLYVSIDNPHAIAVIPLEADLLHPAGAGHKLFGVSQPWETGPDASTTEGPYIIKHGSLYYLFYSGNSYTSSYAEGYATSPSPSGPFVKYAGNPVLKGDKRVHGPGGGSVVQGPDGKLWMVYHALATMGRTVKAQIRNMRIDPLVWHGATVTIPVHP